MVICASSQSGKTKWTLDLLRNKHKIFKEKIDLIIYCYAENQPAFEEFAQAHKDIIFTKNLWDIDKLFELGKKYIVILDDLLIQVETKPEVFQYITLLFTQKSHHSNLSPILLSQNLFAKNIRTISLNCQYLVLFRAVRDKIQIKILNSQFMPNSPGYLISALEDAAKKPYGFLIIDFSHSIKSDKFRVRNFLMPSADMKFYFPFSKK